jgi:hypothetical protein
MNKDKTTKIINKMIEGSSEESLNETINKVDKILEKFLNHTQTDEYYRTISFDKLMSDHLLFSLYMKDRSAAYATFSAVEDMYNALIENKERSI